MMRKVPLVRRTPLKQVSDRRAAKAGKPWAVNDGS